MGKYTEKIEIFSSFRAAMLEYFDLYKEKGKEGRKKSTQSHRVALKLAKHFPSSCNIDIDLNGVDILVEEDGIFPLAVFWSSTYLTQGEKDKAQAFHEEKKPTLTLAFSMLEDKDYILVYRFENEYLEYLHINKSDFSEKLLKRCLIDGEEENKQLMLDIKKRKGNRQKKLS